MQVDSQRRRWLTAVLAVWGQGAVVTTGLAASMPAGATGLVDRSTLAPVAASPGLQQISALPRLLTCWSDDPTRPTRFHAGLPGAPATALALPARGHDIDWHPSGDGSAVVVARRPGSFMVRWQLASGRELARFDTDEASRFDGHLAFSADGRLLYATETDLITGDGRIGVFDSRSLERLDVWPSGGIGPHAIVRLADGRLAVANGGILTLPETGRLKRNLASMDPSLALIDPRDGRLLSQHRLPDAFMSVRHIAQQRDGTVAVALQNEGREPRPLIARLDGVQLRYGEADAALLERCGDYAGDIAAVGEALFAVSCTRAGVTAFWRADGRPAGTVDTPRVCALAARSRLLVASGDTGGLWRIGVSADHRGEAPRGRPGTLDIAQRLAFDNHGQLAPSG
jgi:hypothetical protein